MKVFLKTHLFSSLALRKQAEFWFLHSLVTHSPLELVNVSEF